jgi:hypothetical protein
MLLALLTFIIAPLDIRTAYCTPFLTAKPLNRSRSQEHDPDETVMSANATMVVEEEEAAEDPDQDASIEDGSSGRPRRRAASARRAAFSLSGGAGSAARRKVTLPTATVLFSPGCAPALSLLRNFVFRSEDLACSFPCLIFIVSSQAEQSVWRVRAARPLLRLCSRGWRWRAWRR